MRWLILLALGLAGCGADITQPEPTVIYRTQEKRIEVPVMCAIDVAPVEGPDFTTPDKNIEFAAAYAEGRIDALRKSVESYRKQVATCRERVEALKD